MDKILQGGMDAAGIRDFGVCPMPEESRLLPCRAKSRIPQNAQRIVMCLFPYYVPLGAHNISRYAAVADYHTVAMEMLKKACCFLQEKLPAFTFVPFVDNSPIREVDAAVRAGLGVLGKNGLLLTKRYGSYVFLGEIVTDYPFALSPEPAEQTCCGCGACQRACPGGALNDEGFQKEKCLSFLTQKKGELSPEEQALIRRGTLIWGCDRCQEVCPYNRHPEQTYITAFSGDVLGLLRETEITEQCQKRAFGFRGPGVLERNVGIIKQKTGKL